MTVAELAAYAAPVFWFSPDEPVYRKVGTNRADAVISTEVGAGSF